MASDDQRSINCQATNSTQKRIQGIKLPAWCACVTLRHARCCEYCHVRMSSTRNALISGCGRIEPARSAAATHRNTSRVAKNSRHRSNGDSQRGITTAVSYIRSFTLRVRRIVILLTTSVPTDNNRLMPSLAHGR